MFSFQWSLLAMALALLRGPRVRQVEAEPEQPPHPRRIIHLPCGPGDSARSGDSVERASRGSLLISVEGALGPGGEGREIMDVPLWVIYSEAGRRSDGTFRLLAKTQTALSGGLV